MANKKEKLKELLNDYNARSVFNKQGGRCVFNRPLLPEERAALKENILSNPQVCNLPLYMIAYQPPGSEIGLNEREFEAFVEKMDQAPQDAIEIKRESDD